MKKKIDLMDLSYHVGVLRSMSLVVDSRQKKELQRIARELHAYIKQEIPNEAHRMNQELLRLKDEEDSKVIGG